MSLESLNSKQISRVNSGDYEKEIFKEAEMLLSEKMKEIQTILAKSQIKKFMQFIHDKERSPRAWHAEETTRSNICAYHDVSMLNLNLNSRRNLSMLRLDASAQNRLQSNRSILKISGKKDDRKKKEVCFAMTKSVLKFHEDFSVETELVKKEKPCE